MFQPNTPEPDDQCIIPYLLGAPDERLDELAVADDDFGARLAAAENDLVDAYVRGELSPESRERFESFYLTSEERREKVRFAEAFLLWSSAIPAPADARRRPHGRWPVPRWALGLAACLALLVSAACSTAASGFTGRWLSPGRRARSPNRAAGSCKTRSNPNRPLRPRDPLNRCRTSGKKAPSERAHRTWLRLFCYRRPGELPPRRRSVWNRAGWRPRSDWNSNPTSRLPIASR